MSENASNSRELGLYFALGQVGLEMVAPIGIGIGLDYWLGTRPWIMVAGVILGFVGGLLHIVALLNRLDRLKTKEPDEGES